jgi:hypothetical protein
MSATKKKFSLTGLNILAISSVLLIISEHCVRCPARDWVGGIGTFGLAAGLFVILLDMIAARKERESKHKNGELQDLI